MRSHKNFCRLLWAYSMLAGLSVGCGGDDGGAAPSNPAAAGSGGANAGVGGTGGANAGAGGANAGVGGTNAGNGGKNAGNGGTNAGGGGATGELPAELPLTIVVDGSVKPPTTSWPGLDGVTPRPVVGISGPGGKTFGFVANELILSYKDAAERDAFVAKWSGEILLDLNPAEYGVAGLPAMALVRVNASSASVDDFIPAARKMAPKVSGDHRVSSEDGLKLLTAAMTENVAGRQVSLNWIGNPTGFADRQIEESPSSESLDPYSPNPFSWNHLRAGSVQDIGVTEAWRALELEGKLGNRVKIAILDGGFAPDADFPTSYESASVVAWKDPTNSTSPNYCAGANACNYHGTNVLHVAAGVVNNGFGVAGTGGPVAEAISVVTLADMFTSIQALMEATARGAKIINMSFGIGIPTILAGTILPMQNATTALSNLGIALIASAGNDGDNVDSEECFSICVPFSDTYCWKDCFETYWHFPCENDGVDCIGGIEQNKRTRAPSSNYGTENVRLFAPYSMYLGATPENSDPVRFGSGTSYSAPYVAGVAALVKAANPALSGKEVMQILRDTAHGSPDPVVPGYVNALAAVQSALGGVRPTVRILAPLDGAIQGATGPGGFKLIATSEDYEDGVDAVSISWDSDLDGPLGSGHVRDALLTTPGTRTITATATDSDGKVSKTSVKLTLENAPPSINLISPENSGAVTAGVPFVAAVSTWDPETFGSLPCGSVSWTLQNIGTKETTALGSGCAITVTIPDAKLYELRATAQDNQGAESSDGLVLVVKALPASGPPFVSIVQPLTGVSISPQATAKLVGSAIDPDDPGGSFPLVYTWTGKLTNGVPFPIGTGPIVDWKPLDELGATCGDKTIELTLTVQDGGGEIGTRKATVYVSYPPC